MLRPFDYFSAPPFLSDVAGWVAILTAFFLPLSTTLTNVSFVACALLFIVSGAWIEKLQFIGQRRALLFMLVLFGWMLIGLTYTTAPFSEALKTLLKYDKLLVGVFFVPIFREEKWRHYALHAFFAAIIVTFIAALFKPLGWLPLNEKFGHFLIFKDRIQTSFLIAMAAYFAGVCFLESSQKIMRYCYAIFFIGALFFLFSIDGRSGYFIFFALLIWLLWSHFRWWGLIAGLCAALAIFILANTFSPAFHSRLQESVHDVGRYAAGEKETSLGLRAEFAKHSVSLIKQHPVFGTGTGSFTMQYAHLPVPDDLKTHNPHDQYLHIWVQWGVVGLLLFLGLLFVQWKDSGQLPALPRQIAQGTVLAIVLGSFANSWLLDTTEGHFYVYFVALAFASQLYPSSLKSWRCSQT